MNLEEGGFEDHEELDQLVPEKAVVSRQQNTSEDEDEDLRKAKELSMRSFQADFSLGSFFASDFSPEPVVKPSTTTLKEQVSSQILDQGIRDLKLIQVMMAAKALQDLGKILEQLEFGCTAVLTNSNSRPRFKY